MDSCTIGNVARHRVMAAHAVGSATPIDERELGLRCWVFQVRNKIDILVLNLGCSADSFDREVRLLWLLWLRRWSWWTVGGLLLDIVEVLHSDVLQVVRLKFFAVSGQRHVT